MLDYDTDITYIKKQFDQLNLLSGYHSYMWHWYTPCNVSLQKILQVLFLNIHFGSNYL